MLRSRSVVAITVAVGALLGALGVSSASAAPPTGTDASEVTHWNQVATSTLGALPGPDGGAPPAFSINMGMVQGAVYDAVNAIGPKQHRPYLLDRRTGARASDRRRCRHGRLRRDLRAGLDGTGAGAVPRSRGTAERRCPPRTRPRSMRSTTTPFKKQGVAVGHAAAAAMLDDREGDGRFGPSAWVPNSAPGHWQPLLSPTGAPLLDPTPWAGNVRPFLIQSSSQFRSVPPPALDSAQWATEFNEVKALGRATGSTRTDEQTYIAKWWQSAPVFSWNEVARQLITRTDLDAADSARLLALQNMAGADASINCWNDKYHFDFWRPWNAVPRAAEDDNPATAADPTWTALITAPYPEWTSGHNCLDAANTTVLRMFFGDDPVGGPFQITSTFVNPGGPAVRTFDTFTQPLSRADRGTDLGRPALPQRGRRRPAARPERGQLRRSELLPAGRQLTLSPRSVVTRRPAEAGLLAPQGASDK